MTTVEADDDREIPPDEARRMIRRMIAGVVVPAGRAVRSRFAISGFDPADPKLAEVIAELEAKRAGKGDRP